MKFISFFLFVVNPVRNWGHFCLKQLRVINVLFRDKINFSCAKNVVEEYGFATIIFAKTFHEYEPPISRVTD